MVAAAERHRNVLQCGGIFSTTSTIIAPLTTKSSIISTAKYTNYVDQHQTCIHTDQIGVFDSDAPGQVQQTAQIQQVHIHGINAETGAQGTTECGC